MFVYKIINLKNGKGYIGQTIKANVSQRINYHFGNHKPRYTSLIWNAVKKYGKENFKIEILEKCQTVEELNSRELELIKTHNTLCPNGYNLQAGGQKFKHTEETKKRISLSKKGKPAKGKAAKGIPKSIEHREAMSKVRKGFTSENRIRSAKIRALKLMKPVKCVHILTGKEYIFPSVLIAANILKIQAPNITRVCNGKQRRKQVGGYICTYLTST